MSVRLFYIADTVLPSEKANGVNVVKMTEALSHQFETVMVVPTFGTRKVTVKDVFQYYDVIQTFPIRFIRIPKLPGALFLYAIRVALFFLLKHGKKKTFFYGRSPFVLFLLSLLGYKVALDMHGKIWERGIWRKFVIERLVKNPNSKFMTFNSEPLKRHFAEAFDRTLNRHDMKLVALPNGASIARPGEQFKFSGTSVLRVGYVGSFHQGRGIEVVLELAKRLPHIEFHLAGGPTELVKEFQTSSTSQNIYFYGHIPFSQTAAFRHGCDILIAPYQSNVRVPSGEVTVEYMSPIKIFEYMSSHKPIVCSDFPAIRPILNEKNSILVAADDISAWQRAIVALENVELRRSISKNAFNDFIQNFTWDVRARKVADLVKM